MTTVAWQCLDAIPGLSAVPAVWRRHLGESFEPFRAAFLQTKDCPVRSMPCPRECGCAHLIVREERNPSPRHSPFAKGRRGVAASPAAEVGSSIRGDESAQPLITARCQCEPATCPPISLLPAEI